MPSKGSKGRKGSHKSALSLDSSLGNISLTPGTERERSPIASAKDEDIEIIGYDRVSVRTNADVRAVAQNTLDTALESATYGQVGDSLIYGNSLGHQVIAEREEYRIRLMKVEEETSGLREKTSNLQEEISGLRKDTDRKIFDLRAQVKELRAASEGYIRIRQRFLDTFRRDILNDPAAKWTPMIGAGNAAAHHGDAVTDAGLFEIGDRKDKSLMVKVYGLTADQVLSLSRAGDDQSIAILNVRATLKADKLNRIPQDIENAWEKYVSELEQNWGQLPTEDPTSDLGRAYYGFWDVHGRRVITS